jgi:hypothetical protein
MPESKQAAESTQPVPGAMAMTEELLDAVYRRYGDMTLVLHGDKVRIGAIVKHALDLRTQVRACEGALRLAEKLSTGSFAGASNFAISDPENFRKLQGEAIAAFAEGAGR